MCYGGDRAAAPTAPLLDPPLRITVSLGRLGRWLGRLSPVLASHKSALRSGKSRLLLNDFFLQL